LILVFEVGSKLSGILGGGMTTIKKRRRRTTMRKMGRGRGGLGMTLSMR